MRDTLDLGLRCLYVLTSVGLKITETCIYGL